MLVYAVALLQALGYLCAVPVCVAFCVESEGGLRAGAAAGAFSARSAVRRARLRMLRPVRRRDRAKPQVQAILRLLWHLRHARIRVTGRLGLSDAAATALLCGALKALGAAWQPRAGTLAVDVAPAFDGPCAELRGIIRVRFGQIILAAARSNLD